MTWVTISFEIYLKNQASKGFWKCETGVNRYMIFKIPKKYKRQEKLSLGGFHWVRNIFVIIEH